MLLFPNKKKAAADDSANATASPTDAPSVPTSASAVGAAAAAPVAVSRSFSDFIPYYCHWDANTVLTKNGELMQTIKIGTTASGLDYEVGNTSPDSTAVRETIRQAIGDTIKTDNFALWIHTVRKHRRISFTPEFKEPFALWAHQQWHKKKPWKYQYYNEIYITVMHDGQAAGLCEKNTVKYFLPIKRNRQFRNSYLENAATELNRVVSAMMDKLNATYKTHRLAIVEREGVCYSEPMEFLYHMINLRTDPVPLSETDISQVLDASNTTFGFNALEAKVSGKRRFAALLTIKHYCEVPPDTADRVLQAPMELIISQGFSFTPTEVALKPYQEQKMLFEISGDEQSIAASGLEDMIGSDKGQPVDFGEHQMIIMVMGDDYKRLDNEIATIKAGFGEFGLIPIREDIKLEECFWAQLPGNFEFMRRKSTINTARVGGLCRLNRFTAGTATGNHWGPAVALVPTVVNSPYFFNFHQGDTGHTAWLDFNSFYDQTGYVALNFLLTGTRKYNGRLYIFDHNESAHLLVDSLKGTYHTLPLPVGERHPLLPPATFKINPFTLEDTPRNRSFLLAWCSSLMAPAQPTDAQKEILRNAIEQIYAKEPSERHLPGLIQLIAPVDPALTKILSIWVGNGKFGYLFEGADDGFDPSGALYGFDMTPVTAHPETIIPVFSYLMHKLITSLNGQPTIIVIHEAITLLENTFFAPRLESLLELLKQNNAMAIFTVSNPYTHNLARTFGTIMKQCPTHVYLPDDINLEYFSEHFGLNEYEAKVLQRMKRQQGEFLIKQNNECVGLRLEFSGINELRAILANDSKDLTNATKK
jgi:type IV secretion system protein VirB4